MKIYNGTHQGEDTGESILIIPQDEARTLIESLEKFCEQNKRQIKAKKLLKQLEDNLYIF